ncbi:Vacuolar protein sorting-associated protein 11 [Cichlidogyrus casuarinus]|uniref:Vacuolar protein sorting-associated protein 11 n=1 Tax=Cichlidogyrus casuarinus TaxID=1844966 RepID=A0ABD2PUB8_9PLAT
MEEATAVGAAHIHLHFASFDRVLEHYVQQDDIEMALETCETFGEMKPEIWLIFLRYLLLLHASDQVKMRLALESLFTHSLPSKVHRAEIEEFRLVTPIQVVEILASSDICSIGTIREYLEAYFDNTKREVDKNRAEVQRLRQETHANQQLIRKINSQ